MRVRKSTNLYFIAEKKVHYRTSDITMLLRLRSKLGIHRVSCEGNDNFGSVIEKWANQLRLNVDPDSVSVSTQPGVSKLMTEIAHQGVESLGLRHGDMVTVEFKVLDTEEKNVSEKEMTNMTVSASTTSVPISSSHNKGSIRGKVKESALDIELEGETGLIPRSRSSLCRHGEKGMCEYCSPLPPWDKGYQDEHSIKHISFHAYLKQLDEVTNKKSSGSSYIPPLSEPNYEINLNCAGGHEPWPKGICSKCQPSAITLQQQSFRMVDHVEFQESELINQFIDSWRTTGMQRFGYLYGYYKRYDNVPLGIKAVVEAIWEPPQHDEQDGLTMDMDQVVKEVEDTDKLAREMGLERIGMIFTDLTDTGLGDGSVYCKRHKDSFFLSSLEVIMAAKHQLRHPNVSKFSETGLFSSRFVTCCISGNLNQEIDIATYQVSIEAEGLVEADLISGSTHPSQAYINETNDKRYVPEIFYTRKNEYNLTVKQNAKPAFPVDYLLVSLTHGFPKETDDDSTTTANTTTVFKTVAGFPWTNRQAMGQSQDYTELKRYVYKACTGNDLAELQAKLSNFHFLLYLHSIEVLNQQEWSLLIRTVTAPTLHEATEPLLNLINSPGWQTFVMILEQSM